MILIAMIGLALQYFMQMFFGFRATDANLGAIINILIYTPCFTLISMGIYNIEATHANRRKFHFVCSVIYIAIIAIFALSSYLNQGLYIGKWLYVMLALYFGNVVYCIYMIVQEMIKRKNMLETMAASDMLPYVRYARSSVVILFLAENCWTRKKNRKKPSRRTQRGKKQSQKKRQKSPMTTRWMISTIRPNCQKKEGNSSRKVLTGGVPKWATKTALPIC